MNAGYGKIRPSAGRVTREVFSLLVAPSIFMLAIVCRLGGISRRIRAAWFVLCAAFSALVGEAGELHFFSTKREGTASLAFSVAMKEAHFIDGGQTGSLRGQKPTLHGMEMLEFLRKEGVAVAGLHCSHPHSDHDAGIRELALRRAVNQGELDLTMFDKLLFAAADLPAAESLYQSFVAKHPEAARKAIQFNADSRAPLPILTEKAGTQAKRDLVIDYFRYTPKTDAGPHGRCIIIYILLRDPDSDESTLIVNFDDADSDLIAHWAHTAPPNLPKSTRRVYVAPHHNSDLTNIEPLLARDLRPDSLIITANSGNRFGHPGPMNWKKWIEAIGVSNIHITGTGGGIVVSHRGVAPLNRSEMAKCRQTIVTPQLLRIDQRLDRLHDAWNSGLDFGSLSEARKRAGLNRNELGAEMEVSPSAIWRWENAMTPVPAEARRRLFDLLQTATIRKSAQKLRTERAAYLEIAKALEPDSEILPVAPGVSIKPEISQSQEAVSGAPSPSSIGDYRGRAQRFDEKVRHFGSSTFSERPGIARRAERFQLSTSGRPIFGGIVFGNRATSSELEPVASRFIHRPGENPMLEIKVTLKSEKSSRWVKYDEFTPTELWCAYRVVKPLEEWKTDYRVTDYECNLVGITGSTESSWTFAIHPGIANTRIARDLMALDMLVSRGRQKLVPQLPEFQSYRWFDGPMTISLVSDRELDCRGTDENRSSVLRFSMWKHGEEAKRYKELVEAYNEKVRELRDAPMGDVLDNISVQDLLERINRSSRDPSQLQELLGREGYGGQQNPFRPRRPGPSFLMKSQLQTMRSEIESLEMEVKFGGQIIAFEDAPLVDAAFSRYAPVRRSDRFARLLGILNWLADVDALPDLTEADVGPAWLDVPAQLLNRDLPAILADDPFEDQAPRHVPASLDGASIISFVIEFWFGRIATAAVLLLGLVWIVRHVAGRSQPSP